jgi:hypothetical protein
VVTPGVQEVEQVSTPVVVMMMCPSCSLRFSVLAGVLERCTGCGHELRPGGSLSAQIVRLP